jgi:hypothetical protein
MVLVGVEGGVDGGDRLTPVVEPLLASLGEA